MEIQIQREMDFTHLDLDRVDGYGRTYLHIAAAHGNLNFTQFLLRQRPQFATQVDSKGASPLHLASANGHLEVVKHLLTENQSTCLLQDTEGSTPLHITAKRGHIEVMMHLLDVNQSIFFLEDDKGNTPLHVAANSRKIPFAKFLISKLQQPVQGEIKHTIKHTPNLQKCVIHCGSEALQQIIQADPNFLNGCDNEYRNTLLHTATELRSEEMVTYLIDRGDILIAKNKTGLTALDIIKRSSENDDLYKKIWTPLKRHADKLEPMMENFYEDKRNAILVTASIIATVAFGAGLNPPGGLWQEDKQRSGDNRDTSIGTSVMASTNPFMYRVFLGINTSAFVLSICIMLLLISEIRMNRNTLMHLLTAGMWFAITLIGCSYFQALQVITTTTGIENAVILMSIISMIVWVVLTGVILLDRATWFLTKMRDLFDHATNQHNANNQNYGGDQNNAPINIRN